MTLQTTRPGEIRTRTVALALVAAAVLIAGCRRDPGVAKRAYFDAANRYFAQKNYDEAIIEYRNALKYDPKFGDARYRLGQAYMRTGDAQNAFREYIRAADLLPDNTDVQLTTARFLLVRGQFDEARQRAQRILDRESRNVDAQIVLGNALSGLRDLDGAISQMEGALEIDPQRSGVYATLGQMQRAHGDLAGAETTFKKAVAVAPQSVNAHLALGNFYWSIGRLADAETAFTGALGISQTDPLANRALATLYMSTRREAKAEPFVRAIAAGSTDPLAKLHLADYYIGMQRFDDALAVLTTIESDAAVRPKAVVRIAAIDFARGRKDAALGRLDQLLKANADDAGALLTKGRLLFLDNKVDDALVAVRASLSRDPGLQSAHRTLGMIQERRQDYGEASKALAEAIRLRPTDVAARMELAQVALRSGSVDRAAQIAGEIVAANPRDPAARFLFARTLLAKGDIANATPQVNLLVSAIPKSAAVQSLNGALQSLKHNDQGARRAFQQALDLDGDDLDAFGGLAILDSREGQLAAANARVEGRLAKQPDNAPLVMLSAMLQGAGRDLPKAEQALKRMIELAPSNLTAYSMLAQLYLSQNRLADALNEFEAIAKANPGHIGARTMSAIILEVQGHVDQARERYESILASDPRSAVAANNLAWYYSEHGANLDVALQLAQTAKSLLPDLAPVNDTLGWIYYKKGLADLAVVPLEQSVGLNPNNVLYRYHLGLVYARRGDKAKARAMLAQVVRLKPETSEAAEARKALAAL